MSTPDPNSSSNSVPNSASGSNPKLPPKPPSLLQTLVSVSAAFFGVQSERNRERDFQSGKPLAFILVGIFMTIGFIAMVWFAVQLMLKHAGAS